MVARYLDTARIGVGHPTPRAKSLVHIRSVPSRHFAARIDEEREAAGWSCEHLAIVLGIDKKDAYAMCRKVDGTATHIGKATAEQLDAVLERTTRRAA